MPIKTKFKALLSLSLIAGGVLYATAALAASTTYTYDDLDRLKWVDYDDGTRIEYVYDEIGNRTQTITYTAPTANFTASPATGVFPLTVNFTDTSSGNVSSRLWNFGDNTTSNERSPTHTYYTVNTYSVTLTVTNSLGSNSITKSVTALPSSGPNYVRIAGKGNYTSLQAAYNAAVDGDTIMAQGQVYTENLNVNRNISVTLSGGFVPDYSMNPGTTYLQGTLTTSSGTLNVSNIVLKQ